ncbi:hypothetical protein D2E26_1099 [Bifidobacterium dolichotidis]|uniref:Beta-carotene 15,15'-monooxygenase n=2 Tax=Bifidobacterium dolichotidis TaxID=2306976 RepID=A0A430FQF6_9BIFI|nr:hypothetical protein D2E26_1099 [Bifidobacterium dolichotidis]
MRSDRGLATFESGNVVLLVLTFIVTFAIVWLLVRAGSNRLHLHLCPRARQATRPLVRKAQSTRLAKRISRHQPRIRLFFYRIGRGITRGTNRFWKLLLVLFIGWLWVPTTLLAAFGADVRSQAREFSWYWNQHIGLDQPYIGFFSFVPMDIYPTAHYLWPSSPTYLTDQHNIVLTVFYGGAAAISRYWTGSNDLAFVILADLQFLFAVFVVAATCHRFFNLPWADMRCTVDPSKGSDLQTCDFRHPERGFLRRIRPASGLTRFLILLFFLICPLSVFSTISLTKSPLFAFAFVWWFGTLYELACTRGRVRPRTTVAFVLSVIVMLISAKYAWYILLAQLVLCILADKRRWKFFVLALLLPTLVIHGGISALAARGAIISGDPIESRGVQLQMIARVAKVAPESIPQSAREKLEPVFNLDQMAEAYRRQDADPVKSSGIQSKKTSYRWRTVQPDDLKQFNSAWLEIVEANPRVAMDALFAECYGYFDVFDEPYVPMSYYVDNDNVRKQTSWIGSYNAQWRTNIVKFTEGWGRIPVLGWLTHGNFYVILTLLFGAAELVLRRWRTLSWHIPLLLLMGVMITAPANNFERHMLPVAFVFGFLVLTFIRDSRHANTRQLPKEA